MPITLSASGKSLRLFALLGALSAGMSCWNTALASVPAQPEPDVSLAAMENEEPDDALPEDGWVPVSNDDLAGLRGGFELDAGLKISFGIQRAVYINGDLVTATSVSIPDVAKLTAEQASALSVAVPAVNLIQSGPGNVFDPAQISPAAIATVIQNTLNNQDIKSLTIIDATANSLGLLKDMNFQAALRDSMSAVAGGK